MRLGEHVKLICSPDSSKRTEQANYAAKLCVLSAINRPRLNARGGFAKSGPGRVRLLLQVLMTSFKVYGNFCTLQ